MSVLVGFADGVLQGFGSGGEQGEGEPPPDAVVVKTGTGGIDPLRRHIIKPTGILHLPVKARPSVKERAEASASIAAEVAQRLAREFTEETAALETAKQATRQPVVAISLAEVDAEIGALLRKKLRTEEDEVMFLILMAAVA